VKPRKLTKEIVKDIQYCPYGNIFKHTPYGRGGRIKAGETIGWVTPDGYRTVTVDGKHYPAHRIAMVKMGHNIDDFVIDHIDGNRLNNRYDNLRAVSQRENLNNKSIHRSGRLAGTTKNGNRWVSQIYKNGEHIYLGSFDTEELAHHAYMEAKNACL
jgi:hypothetical protein